ncbi:DUF3006 domain-containing protein [Planococcus shixiaomingii]|uniref:DUF3006 domain-containing protein n=1 Tax=Planococcus shixiaomingii TaxID=3058393 RepID=UPI002609D08E|nr:DUF3006 domain-containing protein [Planococcus sp. N022]WKA55121.1 DUF3006 domain-containing protein [Planococcus sp. N022]
MRGMLDRIEDGTHAVLLIEEQGREIVVPVSQLPAGSQVHTWFTITMEEDEIVSLQLDESLTEVKTEQAQSLMQRLRSRSGSRFKRR